MDPAKDIAAARNGRGSIRKLLSRYSGSSLADEQWRFASTAGKYVRRLAMTLSLAVANMLALSAPIAEMDTTIEKIRPPQEPRMLRANS